MASLRMAPGGANINLSSHTSGYFAATAHTARICRGDSGGPAIREVSTHPVVWGLNQSAQINNGKWCAYGGGAMFFTKTGTNLSWIEERIGRCRRSTLSGQQVAERYLAP